ncbi:MAG: acyltransferase family protein [Pseudobutyrivibrio sp.]|nr:acyltransferase family protein [Pseudobutyrivibrio sp.]
MKQERNSSIELLRIIAALGVFIIHYNGTGGFAEAAGHAANHWVLFMLEGLVICAVDLFVMVSGYFMSHRTSVSAIKPIDLMFQTFIFAAIYYFVTVALQTSPLSVRDFVMAAMPANYYVMFYCVLFLIAPFLNRVIENLSDKKFSQMVWLLLFIFSFWPTLFDILQQYKGIAWNGMWTITRSGTSSGQNIVNFVLVYFIGAYLRRRGPRLGVSQSIICLALISFVLGLAQSHAFAFFPPEGDAYIYSVPFSYANPLVILEAYLVLNIFLQINLGEKPIINRVARAAFTMYLLHPYIMRYLDKTTASANVFTMLLYIVGTGVACYIFSIFAWFLYDKTFGKIFADIGAKHPLIISTK